jgi:hypothetical protein
MIISDASVVSELMRPTPAAVVLAWLRRQTGSNLFTTAITATPASPRPTRGRTGRAVLGEPSAGAGGSAWLAVGECGYLVRERGGEPVDG